LTPTQGSTLEEWTVMRDELSLEQKLEAMLTVALEPISAEELADVVDADAAAVSRALGDLRAEFLEDRRGFQVVELASGWVMQSSPDVAAWVTKFANRDVSHRLSSAALESLAIIAYRQPVSRAQITALRGVNVDGPASPFSMGRPNCFSIGWDWRH
jgi:segregation and condensation protein B